MEDYVHPTLSRLGADDPSLTSISIPAWDVAYEEWPYYDNALRSNTHLQRLQIHIPVGPDLLNDADLNHTLWISFCKNLGRINSLQDVKIVLEARCEVPLLLFLTGLAESHLEAGFSRIFDLVSRLRHLKELSIFGTSPQDTENGDLFPWTSDAVNYLACALRGACGSLESLTLSQYSCEDPKAFRSLFEELASFSGLKELFIRPRCAWVREYDSMFDCESLRLLFSPSSIITLQLSNFELEQEQCDTIREILRELNTGPFIQSCAVLGLRNCIWPSTPRTPSLLSATSNLVSLDLQLLELKLKEVNALSRAIKGNRNFIRLFAVGTSLVGSTAPQDAKKCILNLFRSLRQSNTRAVSFCSSASLTRYPGALRALNGSNITRLSLRFCELNEEALDVVISLVPQLEHLDVLGNDSLDVSVLSRLRRVISMKTRNYDGETVVPGKSLRSLNISLSCLATQDARVDCAASFVEECCDLNDLVIGDVRKDALPLETSQANRLLYAFRGNYSLSTFECLRIDRGNDVTHVRSDSLGSHVDSTISTTTRLNDAGRGYLANDAPSRRKGVQVLASVSDSLDCLFHHLLENPSLCCFPRDEPTRVRRSKRKYAALKG